MPNYVSNSVSFRSIEDAEKVKALVMNSNFRFDFNTIIPMPKELHISSGSATWDAERLLKGIDLEYLAEHYPDEGEAPDPSYFYTSIDGAFDPLPHPKTMPELRVFAELIKSNKEKYGASDWYDWSYDHWGTKWNACDAEWHAANVDFDTAWDEPKPVFMELAKKLGITFDVTAIEEGLAFCSCTTYSPDGMDREEEEGYAGLALVGYSREEILDRYVDWMDEDEIKEIEAELDSLGII